MGSRVSVDTRLTALARRQADILFKAYANRIRQILVPEEIEAFRSAIHSYNGTMPLTEPERTVWAKIEYDAQARRILGRMFTLTPERFIIARHDPERT